MLLLQRSYVLDQVNFSMNTIRSDWIKYSLQKDLHSLCEEGNPPITLLQGMNFQRKSMKQRNHQNLPHIPYLNHHDTQDIETRKRAAKQRIILFPRATNTDQNIAHNTKTTDNTGINKYSKYKALRHTNYQGIRQIQE